MKKLIFPIMIGFLAGLCLNVNALYDSDVVKVTPLLKTKTSWDGTPLKYPEGEAEVTILLVEIAPGGETGWHQHGVPSFAMMIEGEIEVHLKDGKTLHVKEGEAMAEVVDTLHKGINTGDTAAKLVVFYSGASGKTLTLTEAEAAAALL